MTTWTNCLTKTFYGDTKTMDIGRVEVTIDNGNITVEYDDGHYVGTEIGPGHFELKRTDGAGKATLHLFPGGIYLDGWWTEHGEEGMWRIHLK